MPSRGDKMSRIADKHGLTNKYREVGIGKRVVKRGRPRTTIFGSSKRRKANVVPVSENESKIIAIVIASIFSIVMCCFLPVFIPIFVGILVMGGGDAFLKKLWDLPNGKWSMPASLGWMLLTGLEMMVSFIMSILLLIGEMPAYILIIDVIVYVVLSILILERRYKKVLKKKIVETL
jgi:hypothetical protein